MCSVYEKIRPGKSIIWWRVDSQKKKIRTIAYQTFSKSWFRCLLTSRYVSLIFKASENPENLMFAFLHVQWTVSRPLYNGMNIWIHLSCAHTFLATFWECSWNETRDETKVWLDTRTNWNKDFKIYKQKKKNHHKAPWAQAVPTRSKSKALQEITRFKCSVPAQSRKVQNNPPLCKSHTKRCSDVQCSVVWLLA